MLKRYVDLHLHTNCSDGSDSPKWVIQQAAKQKLAAAAITDHDTVAALEEGARAAQALGIEFLPGVEISAHFHDTEVHVLGYGIRADYPALCDRLEELAEGRVKRAEGIVRRLNDLAVPVDFAKVRVRASRGTIGRMHIAQEVHALGSSTTVQGAFDKYIGKGRPAYVEKPTPSCEEVIDLIHQADGLAVIAHPGFAAIRDILMGLIHLPFDGIEIYHSNHTPGQVTQFQQLAKERKLLTTGGSDCHGHSKTKAAIGAVRVPYEHYDRLKQALEER